MERPTVIALSSYDLYCLTCIGGPSAVMESELLHPPNLDRRSTGTLTYLRVKKNAGRTRDPLFETVALTCHFCLKS